MTLTWPLLQVIPGADDSHAKNCFHTSRELGMAIVTSCLKEHAEHYQQQLYRYGCRSTIEPDSMTE
jgi:ATP-dependent Clp protease adapter protein ClpS